MSPGRGPGGGGEVGRHPPERCRRRCPQSGNPPAKVAAPPLECNFGAENGRTEVEETEKASVEAEEKQERDQERKRESGGTPKPCTQAPNPEL